MRVPFRALFIIRVPYYFGDPQKGLFGNPGGLRVQLTVQGWGGFAGLG